MHSRRQFLQTAGMVSLGTAPPAFLAQAARSAGAGRDQRILVVVQLAGGNDGLNTVVPFADDLYHEARPGIRIAPGAVRKLDDHVGLHPAMSGLHELHDDGALAIVQGVGYPDPNRSHFRSMDIWNSAQPDVEIPDDGWLGRALDQGAGVPDGAVPALALGTGRLPLATYSEFGRRVKENGSLGTDHGTASPLFIASPALKKPGLIGAHPNLSDLEANGDLTFGTDFRTVYSTLLGEWLGIDIEIRSRRSSQEQPYAARHDEGGKEDRRRRAGWRGFQEQGAHRRDTPAERPRSGSDRHPHSLAQGNRATEPQRLQTLHLHSWHSGGTNHRSTGQLRLHPHEVARHHRPLPTRAAWHESHSCSGKPGAKHLAQGQRRLGEGDRSGRTHPTPPGLS